MNVRILAETNKGEVVLVHVAQNPDVGEVGDGERIRGSQALRTGGSSYLLVGDHAGGWSADVDNRRRVMGVCPKDMQVIQRGFNGDLRLGISVLRHLQIVQRDSAVFVQEFGASELRARQRRVRKRLPVIGKRL